MTITANATETGTARCRKCGRALRSASSVAAGVGPRCAAVEAATEGLNDRQLDKMAQLLADKAIVATTRKGIYRIVNEAGEVLHTVSVKGNCTCEWGTRRKSAGTKVCYHCGAARLLARPAIRRAAPAAAPVALPASPGIWAVLGAMGVTAGALPPF